MTPTIALDTLRDVHGALDMVVVDVRPQRFYNGWRQGVDVRGGHVPGAVSFPVEWLDSVDAAELTNLVAAKGLRGAGSVVVYGTDAIDAGRFAAYLATHLVTASPAAEISVFDAGFGTWAADASLPVDRLPHHECLVHGDWLKDVLAGDEPEAAPRGPYLLFHVNFDLPEEYAEDHLPGALYLDTNWLEDPRDWNRRSPEALERTLLSLGITHDTTVILYGRDSEGGANEKWPGRRAGQIAAARALTILRYAGVEDLRLLDGGYDGWVRAGHPLETTTREPSPAEAFGVPIPVRPSVFVDLPEAKQLLADPVGAAVVSVRSWREQMGIVSGYDHIAPVGRIKGDVWGNGGTDAYHMQHYRNADNTMRAYPEIARDWAKAGITADKRIAFYCGTGWRASEAWFCAHLQGWERIAVYDGGWFEWSQDPTNNPIEVGEPTIAGRTVA